MNLFYRCLDQIDRWLCAIDDLIKYSQRAVDFLSYPPFFFTKKINNLDEIRGSVEAMAWRLLAIRDLK